MAKHRKHDDPNHWGTPAQFAGRLIEMFGPVDADKIAREIAAQSSEVITGGQVGGWLQLPASPGVPAAFVPVAPPFGFAQVS